MQPLDRTDVRTLSDAVTQVLNCVDPDGCIINSTRLGQATVGLRASMAAAVHEAHELDRVPPKLLRELSAEAFGGYINWLRNRSQHLAAAMAERDDAREGCRRLSERIAAAASMDESNGVELPAPGSEEASAAIDEVLSEYQWPANPKNAARAGFEAARRVLAGRRAGEGIAVSDEGGGGDHEHR